ncbi:MAG: serine hydrolase domain-containing protein [Ferruginibacter sp.]
MKILFGFLTSLLLSIPVLSQPAQDLIDSYLRSMHNIHIIPGFSVVVVKDNKMFFSKGYGVEKLDAGKPFTPATVIAVGSLTKSFTALAIMKLVEKGKLSLDAPVINYLPWFHTANREQSDKITIRMLLSNTSGLYPSNTTPAYDLSEASIETFVRNLSSIYLYREPGNSYEYSNAGFVVAGLVISKISGISYASFLKAEIFQPLDMQHTTTIPGEFNRMKIVAGHYPSVKSVIPANREPEFETGEYAPAGSLLNSSAADIGKYLIALMNENKVVNGKVRKTLWTPNTNFPGLSPEDGGDGKLFSYGLGWMISDIEGRIIIHHGGSTGKTSSFTMIDTANKIAAVILMNVDMTFIDKYAYPTEFNILNNVMRLAAKLPVSAFAKPTIKDPTLNNYELKESKKNRYIGEYKHKNGGDAFVYFGVDMKIQNTSGGKLEGIIYLGSRIVNRFVLDFVNEAVAVSRNVATPAHLTFKLTPGGEITAAWFNNIEFFKIQKDSDSAFKQFKNVFGLVNFNIPRSWKCNFNKSCFSAINENNNATLNGAVMEKEKLSIDTLFRSVCGSSAYVNYESKILTENIGGFIWKQKTYVYEKENKQYELMILVTENARNGYWFMLGSEKKDFTVYIQQVVNFLVRSFRIQ